MLSLDLGVSKDNPLQMIILKAPSDKPIKSETIEDIKPFIEKPYTCDSVALEFSKYITACSCAFRDKDCYSPYFALCQSSGSGKTRLLLEVSKYHPIIFINCKDVQGRLTSLGFTFLMNEVINVELMIRHMQEKEQVTSQLEKWIHLYVTEKAIEVASFFQAISFWVYRYLLETTSGKAFKESIIKSQMKKMTLEFFQHETSSKIWNDIMI